MTADRLHQRDIYDRFIKNKINNDINSSITKKVNGFNKFDAPQMVIGNDKSYIAWGGDNKKN